MCSSCANDSQIEEIRHSLAHALAAAILVHYPQTQLTLGPAVKDGFYYDVDLGDEKLGEADLKPLLKTMRNIQKSWKFFSRIEVTADEAREFYKTNPYKKELIEEIIERGDLITFYVSGPKETTELPESDLTQDEHGNYIFVDLCRGGHHEPLSEIDQKSFELDRIAGAYWRGDENNKMLTRIYGIAFSSKEHLKEFKELREEAKKRDHRKLGKELDLFTFSDLVGPGLPMFTPKGTLMRDLIMDKIMGIQKRFGYQKVTIPHITKPDLYHISGHWDKYKDDLFHVRGKNDSQFVMKPMNCPHHTQIYASQPRSYKDLPVRYMEQGVVYRDEQAGELIGLSRVRSISQDDGHVFCRPDQIKQEVKIVINVIKEFYTAFDMLEDGKYWVSLSVRDSQNKEKYLGDDALWEKAEAALEEVAKEEGLNYKRVEGEAAFYGPKLDFQFYDALGRERQLGTAQLDFNMPQRFELTYTDSNGEKQTPVMIHRAVAGSLERFMAVMIEHFAGHLPVWISPIQIAVMPVSPENHGDHSEKVVEELKKAGIRAEHWNDNESLGKRIRQTKLAKIPFQIVIGDKEKESGIYAIEGREEFKKEGMSVEDIIEFIKE